jgi:hypothetical protein
MNKLTKLLLDRIRNETFEDRIANLLSDKTTNYSVWKVTKAIKKPQIQFPPIKDDSGKVCQKQ